MLPKPLVYLLITLTVMALLPPAIIARARANRSPKPRIHIFQDMDNQTRYKAQQVNPISTFAGRMRSPTYHADAHTHVDEASGA